MLQLLNKFYEHYCYAVVALAMYLLVTSNLWVTTTVNESPPKCPNGCVTTMLRIHQMKYYFKSRITNNLWGFFHNFNWHLLISVDYKFLSDFRLSGMWPLDLRAMDIAISFLFATFTEIYIFPFKVLYCNHVPCTSATSTSTQKMKVTLFVQRHRYLSITWLS